MSEMIDPKDPLVCCQCGGTDIETKAWVNPNTHEYIQELENDGDSDDNWCNKCEEHIDFQSKSEYDEEVKTLMEEQLKEGARCPNCGRIWGKSGFCEDPFHK